MINSVQEERDACDTHPVFGSERDCQEMDGKTNKTTGWSSVKLETKRAKESLSKVFFKKSLTKCRGRGVRVDSMLTKHVK